MKKNLWLLLLSFGFVENSFAQIGWWTSSDTLNVFNKNKGAVLIGSYQPLGKLTVGPDDKFYNLSLVGDYNNLAKNYLQIGVTGRGFENLQGQTIFDLYHSNTQFRNAGYNFRINGQSQFFINGEGNIGIGTERPEAKLDLTGGPNWGGFTKAMRVPGEHAIKFESNGSEYGVVATGGMLNFVTSNQNESTNPFGVPFSRIMSLQRNKVVIEGDIEVKGKIYSQGQVGGGGDIPVDNGGGGSGDGSGGGGGKGDGGILPTIAPQGSGAQDWVISSSNANDIYYTYGSGKVGIGTNNPADKFDVIGRMTSRSATGGSGLKIDGYSLQSANNYSGINILGFNNTTANNSAYGYTGYANGTTGGSPVLMFRQDNWAGQFSWGNTISPGTWANYDEKMRLDQNGNLIAFYKVGVGTSTPAQKVEVVGSNSAALTTGTGADGILRLQPSGSNATIDFGMLTSPAYAWFQSRSRVDYSVNYNLVLNPNGGSVGIGTTNPGTDKLAVNGTIRAKELYLTTTGWSDFVFDQGYNLRTLKQVENFIRKNGHLPEIPSEKEIEEKGVGVIDMQSKLLQKIEELTLYLIEQNRKNEEQNKRIQELEDRLKDRK